nr:MAG TPA: hypothetical protein [Caudoviricetes sp.]
MYLTRYKTNRRKVKKIEKSNFSSYLSDDTV